MKLHEYFTCGILCSGALRALAAIVTLFTILSCTSPSVQYVKPPPETSFQTPPTQVYFYPNKGQGLEQQERDRYECYLWAVRKTGFDPSVSQLAPHQRVEVIPQPPLGHDTAAGAVTGALLGAIVSAPHHTAEGAAIGAAAGAVLGSVSDAGRQEQTQRLQNQYNLQEYQQAARIEKQARDYRRAMSACLEGRGYSVSSIW